MVNVSKIIQAGGKKIADFGEPTSAKVFGGEAPDETITKLDSGDLLIKSMNKHGSGRTRVITPGIQ